MNSVKLALAPQAYTMNQYSLMLFDFRLKHAAVK